MTIAEVVESLKVLGVEKPFRVIRDDADEREKWLVRVRKPAHLVEGRLCGTEILIVPESKSFRVWTSQKQLVRALAGEHGLKAELLDGEAVLWVPASLADVVLPRFGAKVRRIVSDAQKAILAAGRSHSPIYKTSQG